MKNNIVHKSLLAIYYFENVGKAYSDNAAGRQLAASGFLKLKEINPEAMQRAKEKYLTVVREALEAV